MKIKILKTGKFSLHPAWGPAVNVTEGQELSDVQFEKVCRKVDTNPIDAMKELIGAKWAIEVEDETDVDEEDEEDDDKPPADPLDANITDVSAHLTKLTEGKEDDEKKQIIQDWGMVNCNQKVSKAKNVDNMIAELVDLYAELNTPPSE